MFLYWILIITDTSRSVNNALKVCLDLEDLKFKGDLTRSQRVKLDFMQLKGKVTLACIVKMVNYLDKDQEKLKDVFVTNLTDIVRWADKLLLEPLPYYSASNPLLLYLIGYTISQPTMVPNCYLN